MSRNIYVHVSPFDKDTVLLALEAGVHGVIVDDAYLAEVQGLARCEFLASSQVSYIQMEAKEDERAYADAVRKKESPLSVLSEGWEIIPVENLLAEKGIAEDICLEVHDLERARLALGILERGVNNIVLTKDALGKVREIIQLGMSSDQGVSLECATVTAIKPVGLGHRVCVDTMSLLQVGQGMLTGNSSAFTFLVHAETEENSYVNSRPFRVNAGAVHAYAMMPNDKTAYLEELSSGDEVLIVGADGKCSQAVVGRVKVEVRPMLYIEAVSKCGKTGGVFLQNAETIRVVDKNKKPLSVVSLKVGDEILCHLDSAGRHFGMRVDESISE